MRYSESTPPKHNELDSQDDPFRDPDTSLPAITLSSVPSTPSKLPVRKRVAFAEPLSTPTSTHDDDEDEDAEMTPSLSRSGSINEDFDFSGRQNPSKTTRLTGIQRKLFNKKSSIRRHNSSSSNNAESTDSPQRNSSTSSKSGRRISQSLEAMFGSSSPRSPSQSVPSPAPTTSPVSDSATYATSFSAATPKSLPATELACLPNDRLALESLINIHLSKLDRYKRQVSDFNTVICSLYDDLSKLGSTPEAQAVPQLVTGLEMEIEETRAGRDSKRKYVEFHRGELRTIAEKRAILDEEIGVFGGVEVLEELEGDEVWDARFW